MNLLFFYLDYLFFKGGDLMKKYKSLILFYAYNIMIDFITIDDVPKKLKPYVIECLKESFDVDIQA